MIKHKIIKRVKTNMKKKQQPKNDARTDLDFCLLCLLLQVATISYNQESPMHKKIGAKKTERLVLPYFLVVKPCQGAINICQPLPSPHQRQ